MARTRSSRLFVVLLHLVGVSTDLPNSGGRNNPLAIVLEKVQLTHEGLEGIIRYMQQQELEDDALSQPFWLQDEVDGLCLGPLGFSQCGEATLWHIQEASTNKRRRRRRVVDLGLALQYHEPTNDGQCLLYSKSSSTQQQQRKQRQRSIPDAMGSCHASLDRVFSWKLNGRGVLHRDEAKRLLLANQQSSPQCLWRVNATQTSLAPCNPNLSDASAGTTTSHDDDDDNHNDNHNDQRLAQLSLVRYQPASVVQDRETRILAFEKERAANATRDATANATATTAKNQKAKKQKVPPVVAVPEEEPKEEQQHIRRSKDLAHSHASQPLQHAEVKSNNKKRMGSVVGSTSKSKLADASQKETKKKSIFDTLQDTNPILFLGDTSTEQQAKKDPPASKKDGNIKMIHGDAASYKLRRLQTHPYIAASKNELWVDPQTNLEYRTDLCHYLGHDRKSAGRHTLAGVGYYTKTVLNIKVYGVALYVSKRDVLADPTFEQYASMTSDELRETPPFYGHLREMPSPHDPNAGLVDRTIFLKLNMQLSVETMQSSLHATWKLLTDENKMLLINSSMHPRPAEERMLQTIASAENTGRCSCGQVAPPEYKADKTCCARGTELVFTWRKNGNLEIRLDGRVMDIFPRPDVARGIFYEYLRTDDPISPGFTAKVVDGFPFLLGPLAQVKGMPQAIQMNDAVHHEKNAGIGKAVGNFADMMGSHAGEFAGWVHHGASGAAGNLGNAAKSIGASAKSVSYGLDRRRDQLWNQVSENGKHFIQRRLSRGGRQDELAASISHYMKRHRRGESQTKRYGGPRGRVFRSSVNQWLGSEDDSDDIVSTVANPQKTYYGRLIFLYMSHLYLLLLLIVSLPGTHHTTKQVVRRSKKFAPVSYPDDASVDASTESSSSADDSTGRKLSDTWTIGSDARSPERHKGVLTRIRERRRSRMGAPLSPPSSASSNAPAAATTGMKKSLSYYL